MTKTDRQAERTAIRRVELVTIFRDEQDLPYDRLVRDRDQLLSSAYTLFSVVALLRDMSHEGLGIQFEGQQIMAANLLKPKENYVVKLTLMLEEVPVSMAKYIKGEGHYSMVLLKATCRWHESKEGISTAGFVVRTANPSAVLGFIREHFCLG
jgi:hypothetical protein